MSAVPCPDCGTEMIAILRKYDSGHNIGDVTTWMHAYICPKCSPNYKTFVSRGCHIGARV